MYRREPGRGEAEDWVAFMKILLKDIRPGETYVYFDGYVIPTAAQWLGIEGWHARHELEFVPQVAARTDPKVDEDLLSSREYWQSRRIERGDD
jgi:hypothetical protein